MFLVSLVFSFLILTLTSCNTRTLHPSYIEQYRHLSLYKKTLKQERLFSEDSNYYVVLLVDAKHLDYSSVDPLVNTISKHPDGSYDRTVGHAWFVLVGVKDGRKIAIEGGHSGELGEIQEKYLDGLLNPQKDNPNPASYLFTSLKDGYFEKGSGRHRPTYAIRLDINEEIFSKIYWLVQPKHYNYEEYSLTTNQCSSLVAKIACIAGLKLEHETSCIIPQKIFFQGREITLWKDHRYQSIVFSTPDKLEESMINAVNNGLAKPAMRWYKNVWQILEK